MNNDRSCTLSDATTTSTTLRPNTTEAKQHTSENDDSEESSIAPVAENGLCDQPWRALVTAIYVNIAMPFCFGSFEVFLIQVMAPKALHLNEVCAHLRGFIHT